MAILHTYHHLYIEAYNGDSSSKNNNKIQIEEKHPEEFLV